MLIIRTKDGLRDFWSVEDKGRPGVRVGISVNQVLSVIADGPELDLIKKTFHNLPITDKSSTVWYDDHAKFIVGNIG